MSSIVASPEYKAEHSIYAFFSGLLTLFLLHTVEYLENGKILENFFPNPALIIILTSFFTAGFIFSKPDENWIHERIQDTSANQNEYAEFMLLGSYLLRTYALEPSRIHSPRKTLIREIETILEGGNLDGYIWRLRGAFWFVLSVPFSTLIGFYYLDRTPLFGIVLATGLAIAAGVAHCANEHCKKGRDYLLDFALFYWFDKNLTAVRRTQVTPTVSMTRVRLEAKGFGEAFSRPKAKYQDSSSDSDINEKEIKEPKILLNGYMEEIQSHSRETKRRLTDLLHSECEWLRELIKRQNWSALSSRLKDLKQSVIQMAYERNDALDEILLSWKMAMLSNTLTPDFRNLKDLLYLMKEGGYLDKFDESKSIRSLLKPKASNLTNRHWAFSYYRKVLRRKIGFKDKFEDLFEDVAEVVLREDAEKRHGPYPTRTQSVETTIMAMEHDHAQKYYSHVTVFEDVPIDNLERAKPADYSHLED